MIVVACLEGKVDKSISYFKTRNPFPFIPSCVFDYFYRLVDQIAPRWGNVLRPGMTMVITLTMIMILGLSEVILYIL